MGVRACPVTVSSSVVTSLRARYPSRARPVSFGFPQESPVPAPKTQMLAEDGVGRLEEEPVLSRLSRGRPQTECGHATARARQTGELTHPRGGGGV